MKEIYKSLISVGFFVLFMLGLLFYIANIDNTKELSQECKEYYSQKEQSRTYEQDGYIYITHMNLELEEKCQLEK